MHNASAGPMGGAEEAVSVLKKFFFSMHYMYSNGLVEVWGVLGWF